MLILVVGAGVVGLAVGRALALRTGDVIVAEKSESFGTGISSRNSEVVHAGMYYPRGSLRQRHCVAGRRRLYDYCDGHRIAHRRCGKLIVATTAAETAKITTIFDQGLANGVEGLSLLDGEEARRLEPALRCSAAVLSSDSGIVDSHALMLAFLGDIEDSGGTLAIRTPVETLRRTARGWVVGFGGADPDTILVDAVVNCAGLDAQRLAGSIDDYPPDRIPPLVLAKGNYFACAGRPPFSRLIYPAPVDGGLGVHATLDLAGRTRFGPDVEWIDHLDYAVAPERAASFYEAIRRYWPGLPDGALAPDYAGIRPKLTGPGQPAADFIIDGPAQHGLPGLVHLFGMESPGLTCSLSVAEEVAQQLGL
ncbi:MAG TPA: NAD(P)/FAD-dependent oxidoreductase [Lichenihabitans sp.]|jgi:L-2-hydroxyglutarate oxidase LhgO|nr:NAD(P)/FAD-dependent oxidoreductase [Lichenihabitans sp.]